MSTSQTIREQVQELEINLTKIKGGCQSGRKVVIHNSKSDLALDFYEKKVIFIYTIFSQKILESSLTN